jgi:hypothetical protein
MRQDCAPGDWKRENIPESVLRLEPQAVSSWPRLRESLKGRKTTQIDLATSMRTSLNERRNWECPTTMEKMREYMNDCPAYRRMQGFFVDICLLFERSDLTWNKMSYRLELILVSVYQILAEYDVDDLQKAVSYAATKLKCRLTTNELFSSLMDKSWRERYPDVLIPAWLWLLRRTEAVDLKSSIEEDFHKDGIASQVFQQMWPRLNKKNTGVLDLMLCSVCVWYLLPISPGSRSRMGVFLLEIILNQVLNPHMEVSTKDLQRIINLRVADLTADSPPSPLANPSHSLPESESNIPQMINGDSNPERSVVDGVQPSTVSNSQILNDSSTSNGNRLDRLTRASLPLPPQVTSNNFSSYHSPHHDAQSNNQQRLNSSYNSGFSSLSSFGTQFLSHPFESTPDSPYESVANFSSYSSSRPQTGYLNPQNNLNELSFGLSNSSGLSGYSSRGQQYLPPVSMLPSVAEEMMKSGAVS